MLQTVSELRKNGHHTGSSPFGYTRDTDMHLIKPNRDACIVRDIFALWRLNCDVDTIAALHSMTAARIRYILNNPCYYGYIKCNGELVQGAHEPIISGKYTPYTEYDESRHALDQYTYAMNRRITNKV